MGSGRRAVRAVRRPGLFVIPIVLGLALGPTATASAGGRQLWVSRYDGPGHGTDSSSSVAVSPDGSRVFVTGYSGGSGYGGASDYATVAYEPGTGRRLWVARYDGAGRDDHAFAVVVSPDGSKAFVTGWSVGADGNSDYGTVAYDASTGRQLWAMRYHGPGDGNDDGTALVVSPDGSKVFVTGYIAGSDGYADYATVAYGASDGAQIWVRTYDDPDHSDDVALAVVASPDGSKVFVTGWSGAATGPDYGTVAYDASAGRQLWAMRYDGPGHAFDMAFSIAVSPGGSRVFVTGESDGGSTYNDYATVAYEASTGRTLWVGRYDGGSDDHGRFVGVSPGGKRVFVTGDSFNSETGDDYTTVAYSAATGKEAWTARYDGPAAGEGTDIALSLGVSPGGRKVFVTGYSYGIDTNFDAATVTYATATGSELWVARYDGPSHQVDTGESVAASPDGKSVYVTGPSTGGNGLDDYATVAYAA